MFLINHAPGGLLISRWDGDGAALPLEQIYVASQDLPAFIADLISVALQSDEAECWDTYAALCGNPDAWAVPVA